MRLLRDLILVQEKKEGETMTASGIVVASKKNSMMTGIIMSVGPEAGELFAIGTSVLFPDFDFDRLKLGGADYWIGSSKGVRALDVL